MITAVDITEDTHCRLSSLIRIWHCCAISSKSRHECSVTYNSSLYYFRNWRKTAHCLWGKRQNQ